MYDLTVAMTMSMRHGGSQRAAVEIKQCIVRGTAMGMVHRSDSDKFVLECNRARKGR